MYLLEYEKSVSTVPRKPLAVVDCLPAMPDQTELVKLESAGL